MVIHYRALPASISPDRELVGSEQYIIFVAAHDDGVNFIVTEGHRTEKRQAQLRYLYEHGNGNLAARPSPTAPHIRTGQNDHADDLVSRSGSNQGAADFARWARKKGIRVDFEVPGEDWHIHMNGADITRVAKQLTKKPDDWFLSTDERSWLHSYDHPRDRGQQVRARNRLRARVRWLYAAWKTGKRLHRKDTLHRGARHAYLRARVSPWKK